jgi:hypothetical protein
MEHFIFENIEKEIRRLIDINENLYNMFSEEEQENLIFIKGYVCSLKHIQRVCEKEKSKMPYQISIVKL